MDIGFFVTHVDWDKVKGRLKHGSGQPGDEWYEEIEMTVKLRGSGNTENIPTAAIAQEFMDKHLFTGKGEL